MTISGLGTPGIIVFVVLFVIFAFLGFFGRRFRKGDETILSEWSLAGRKLGVFLTWFLIGADLYTAYTFVAVPSGLFAKGALYFFAVPYVSITFAIALVTMPKLWVVSKKKGYITASDFVQDVFSSKTLALLIALTGIVAELPYVALQIIGMKAVLTVMFPIGANISTIVTIALVISFIVLVAFTFMSGLRGVTLTAVFKDAIIFTSVIVIIIAVPLAYGGFQHAFSVKAAYSTLNQSALGVGYTTLWIGSAMALYLYPHAVNGSLSSKNESNLRMSTALLPIYGIGLALLALFGVLIYAVGPAMTYLSHFPASSQGIYVVPALVLYTMPSWFAGFALLGIFIGGLVPAAIMAMASANLFARNVANPFMEKFRTKISPSGQTIVAKIATVVFIFIALGFTFLVPETYSIQLQLLGGIIILQILPSLFLGLYFPKLNKHSLIVGWAAGLIAGIYLEEVANNYGALSTSFYGFGTHNLLYIGLFAVAINILIAVVGSIIARAAGIKNSPETGVSKEASKT
ncbi:MAG: sodium:solute symporter [Candidatus Thermoplasmatota archaeon]|nr:sodium:solute symporter [Candidatus Thermoplasmatota archaeon]